MRGRTWVTGLGDACARLGVEEGDAAAYLERMIERRKRELERSGEPPLPEVKELSLVVRGHLWRAFLDVGHAAVFAWLDEQAPICERDLDLQAKLDDFLWARMASNTS